MKSIASLKDISSGRLYDINDMVKADAGGCDQCSHCCHDVGDYVVLNPYDVYLIGRLLNMSFGSLLDNHLDVKHEGKRQTYHLKMAPSTKACTFLNESGWCSIHTARPDICRLFPLGRVYEEGDFKYFLQDEACTKPKLNKIKLKKWIQQEDYKDHKAFILDWYAFNKALDFRMKFVREDSELESMNTYIADHLFSLGERPSTNFFADFNQAMIKAKDYLGII